MNEVLTSVEYTGTTASHRMPWREFLLFAGYQVRLLNWWLFLLMSMGFLASCGIFWLEVRAGTPIALGNASELSRFVLESGAGLIAGMLASSLIVGDPALEVTMTTRAGILAVTTWRYLLTLLFLLLPSVAYLVWTLLFHIVYSAQPMPLFLVSLWCAPVLVMSMLGLSFSLLTRNAALGTVISAIPLMAALFLHDELLNMPALRPFFIPFSIWGHDAPDWWLNRAVLIGIALLLACGCWWWMRREERLLGSLH